MSNEYSVTQIRINRALFYKRHLPKLFLFDVKHNGTKRNSIENRFINISIHKIFKSNIIFSLDRTGCRTIDEPRSSCLHWLR